MRAIVLDHFGGLDSLVIKEIPEPEPKPGHVVIQVKAWLSDVPLQAIAQRVAAGKFNAKPSRVFRFEDIREAHRVMEANEANGKMVVKL